MNPYVESLARIPKAITTLPGRPHSFPILACKPRKRHNRPRSCFSGWFSRQIRLFVITDPVDTKIFVSLSHSGHFFPCRNTNASVMTSKLARNPGENSQLNFAILQSLVHLQHAGTAVACLRVPRFMTGLLGYLTLSSFGAPQHTLPEDKRLVSTRVLLLCALRSRKLDGFPRMSLLGQVIIARRV